MPALGLVGHTGFVGGNLLGQARFDCVYNSKTIGEIRGAQFDTLVVAGVPATMWVANNEPERDRGNILELFEHLRYVKVGKLALVSSIAVYADPAASPDEACEAFEKELPYGRHRGELESLVEAHFDGALILRLPALFGERLKKNFVFDLLNPTPSFLKHQIFARLDATANEFERGLLAQYFSWHEATALWCFDRDAAAQTGAVRSLDALSVRSGVLARNFTNSDNQYQFYNLAQLWRDIERGFEAGLRRLNLSAEPLLASEVAQALTGEPFSNAGPPRILQDMRSRHAGCWGRADGYLYGAEESLGNLKAFFKASRERLV